MIRVVLEIDNYSAMSISPLELVAKHILNPELKRVDYTLFRLPFDWKEIPYSSNARIPVNKYTVEIKDIEQT